MATVIVAELEGCIGLSKTGRNEQILVSCGQGLIDILQTIRTN